MNCIFWIRITMNVTYNIDYNISYFLNYYDLFTQQNEDYISTNSYSFRQTYNQQLINKVLFLFFNREITIVFNILVPLFQLRRYSKIQCYCLNQSLYFSSAINISVTFILVSRINDHSKSSSLRNSCDFVLLVIQERSLLD